MVASASRPTLTPTVTATPFHDGAVFWGSQVSGGRLGISIFGSENSAVRLMYFGATAGDAGHFEADGFARAVKLHTACLHKNKLMKSQKHIRRPQLKRIAL